MAIRASDAIRAARALIGTPYGDLDCIGLIKRVIRTAPGGVPGYTTAGTNTLWRSYDSAAKYRDLTWRQEGLRGAEAGMLAFKRSGKDVHHVGIVTGEGTVIHSSSAKGGVVETALDGSWALLARHRYIETAGAIPAESEEQMESYEAAVSLANPDSTLNVRAEPGTGGQRVGRLGHGARVTVVEEMENGWARVTYGDGQSGYVDGGYLRRVEEEAQEARPQGRIVIRDSAGNVFWPDGAFTVRVAVD